MNDIEGKAARGAVSEPVRRSKFWLNGLKFAPCPHAFTQCPVVGDEFGGTDLEVVFAHDFQGAVVLC